MPGYLSDPQKKGALMPEFVTAWLTLIRANPAPFAAVAALAFVIGLIL